MRMVAVVTRTKDRPVFLRRAIESVAGQTLTDYVHVIVNDGGNKNDVERVVSGFNDDIKKRIKVFHRTESSGAPDTIFNESIDRIDSKYFAIHDDDDTWHRDFLRNTVERLDANPDSAAVVVHANKIVEDFDGANIIEKSSKHYLPDLKAISLYRQCADNQFTPIATLLRRSSYEAVGKFDNRLPVVGDWEFGLRLLQKFDVEFFDPGYPLAFYHHRIVSDNSFTNHNHRYWVNKVMNKYLREELANGRLGVGYIMNQIRFDKHERAEQVRRILPNFLIKKIRAKISD